jgi:hypothetical protein
VQTTPEGKDRPKLIVPTAEMAVRMQNASGESRLAGINEQLLTLYRNRQPYHESPPAAKAR